MHTSCSSWCPAPRKKQTRPAWTTPTTRIVVTIAVFVAALLSPRSTVTAVIPLSTCSYNNPSATAGILSISNINDECKRRCLGQCRFQDSSSTTITFFSTTTTNTASAWLPPRARLERSRRCHPRAPTTCKSTDARCHERLRDLCRPSRASIIGDVADGTRLYASADGESDDASAKKGGSTSSIPSYFPSDETGASSSSSVDREVC